MKSLLFYLLRNFNVSVPVRISIVILVCVLLGLGAFTAYRIVSSTIDNTDYLSKGDQQFSAKQYSSALASYQKALEKTPDNPVLYQKIARIYELKNKYSEAIDRLQKGLEKNKDSADLNFQIGEDASILIPTDNKYKDLAIDTYLIAAKDTKYKNIATYKAARLISTYGTPENLNRAKELYKTLNTFQPALYELVMYEIDNPDTALSQLAEITKVAPQPDQDLLNGDFNGWVEFDKALRTELNVLKQDVIGKRSKSTVLNSKGYVAYKLNRCEFGVDFLKGAISESEKEVFYPQARLILGECYKRLGNYTEAKAFLEPVYQKNKDSVDVRLILRQVYKGLKDTVSMKKMYDELVILDGQNPLVRYEYATDMELVSDWNTAASQYEWLATNLADKMALDGVINENFVLSQRYLLKSYSIYTYQIKDYKKAEMLINQIIKNNPKILPENQAVELITWVKYMQNSSDKTLEDAVYNSAKEINTTDALYHYAYIAKNRGEKQVAKDKALAAYDMDVTGYVGPLAADLINSLDK